ncbi:unnamed protein product, partial [Iphiclides podalirius]
MQVTVARNAKTLSPSHVKQCILAETRFDFLRDLVKNIPDVSAAEEKELMSAESSPNSSRFPDAAPPRRIARQDSNSSSGSDAKLQQPVPPREGAKRASAEASPPPPTLPPPPPPPPAPESAIDLSRRQEARPVRTANFYQETLVDEHPSVITVNPTYLSPQPSTSSYATLEPVEVSRADRPPPHAEAPKTPVAPVLNIDFTKSLAKPEIKVLDTAAAGVVAKGERNSRLPRQNSRSKHDRKVERKVSRPADLDHFTGNLQIDEDYDT